MKDTLNLTLEKHNSMTYLYICSNDWREIFMKQ